jgi:hypothetical protein
MPLCEEAKKRGVLLVFVVPERSRGFAKGLNGFTPQKYVGEEKEKAVWEKCATQMIFRVSTTDV